MPAILTDNFNDNVIDTAKWDVSAIADFNAGVTVAETGGQIVITPLSATAGSNRNGLTSDATFNLTQGFAIWKLPQIAGPVANAVTRCGVYLDANNWIGFEVQNTTLTYRKRAASTDSNTTATYNSTNHKYLMLHHCGTIVNWYTSADGVTWAAARTGVAPGFAVTSLKLFLDAGTIGSVATPGTAIFDDVEIGTLDLIAPFEQLAAFGGFVDLIIDPGFPLNIDVAAMAGEVYTVPMARRRGGSRISSVGVCLRGRVIATGAINTFDIWIPSPNPSATTIRWNFYVEGVPVWSGVNRPGMATGINHVQKADVDFAVTIGQKWELHVEGLPAGGVEVPVDMLARIVAG